MLIPLIPKDPDKNDFTCRDGEIDFVIKLKTSGSEDPDTPQSDDMPSSVIPSLTMEYSPMETTIRIPLQSGDKPKAELLLNGEITRVDPATAERLTQAMVQKAAECLLDLTTDLRRQGLFILPFRFYTMQMTPDGTLSYPSPQGVALPSDFPPHPEITAASVTDDCLTLAIRFPVSPHRLTISAPDNLPEGHSLRTFISYPLYIPDPKEMRGSIGSVRSASGGNATGIRFAFLSKSAIKGSVAAPEKYYELVGNERTGYRISSKAAPAPAYSCYATIYGYTPPFPREALLVLGTDMDEDTDPLDWIADWEAAGNGYLPLSLPYKYRNPGNGDVSAGVTWPEGIDAEFVMQTAAELGASYVLLTRPMTLASGERSRRYAVPVAIRRIRIPGIPSAGAALAALYGSDDCVRWRQLRRFDPRRTSLVLAPPRSFWRLLLWGSALGFNSIFLDDN